MRTARYVCVIAYIDEDGKEHVYRGECEGLIHDKLEGENGFGYDPIFYYPAFKTTLANVSEEKKIVFHIVVLRLRSFERLE